MIHVSKTKKTVCNLGVQLTSHSTSWKKADSCDVLEVHILDNPPMVPMSEEPQDHLEIRFHTLASLDDLISTLTAARVHFGY